MPAKTTSEIVPYLFSDLLLDTGLIQFSEDRNTLTLHLAREDPKPVGNGLLARRPMKVTYTRRLSGWNVTISVEVAFKRQSLDEPDTVVRLAVNAEPDARVRDFWSAAMSAAVASQESFEGNMRREAVRLLGGTV